MTDTTNYLNLPLIAGGGVQGYVIVNENLLVLEWMAAGGKLVTITATNTPPGSPAEGDAYLVGASPTGVWDSPVDKANKVVLWSDITSAWSAGFDLKEGMTFWATNTNKQWVWNGSAFEEVTFV